jgi:hypothetical protein
MENKELRRWKYSLMEPAFAEASAGRRRFIKID